MDPSLATVHDGRKYMWDGRAYASAEEARAAVSGYERERFEVRLVERDGAFFVYTRRAVSGSVTGSGAP
jgi:hypothetical protein